jgi:hypothetical protein
LEKSTEKLLRVRKVQENSAPINRSTRKQKLGTGKSVQQYLGFFVSVHSETLTHHDQRWRNTPLQSHQEVVDRARDERDQRGCI